MRAHSRSGYGQAMVVEEAAVAAAAVAVAAERTCGAKHCHGDWQAVEMLRRHQ